MLSGSPSRTLNVNRMDVAYRSTSGTNPPTPLPSEETDEVVPLASVILLEAWVKGSILLLWMSWWLLLLIAGAPPAYVRRRFVAVIMLSVVILNG